MNSYMNDENPFRAPHLAVTEQFAPRPARVDSFVLSFPNTVRRLSMLAAIVGLFSTLEFLIGLAIGRPFIAPPKWRFFSFLALPVGLGLWAMSKQTVRVTPESVESHHFFSHRKLDRSTCRLRKADSVSYSITDAAGQTNIRVHRFMGENAVKLFEEITAARPIT